MLKFNLTPTLEHLTLSSLSRELWKQPDIASGIKELFHSRPGNNDFPFDAVNWPEIRRQVLHKLTLLHLPDMLKDKAEDVVEITGRQILIWVQKYNKQFFPEVDMVNFLHLLQWNSLGGIDEKKTAALILETKNGLSLEHRYILACNNCLEESVPLLWDQIPDHQTMSLFTNMSNDLLNGEANLVQYWSYYNEGALDVLDSLLSQYNRRRTRRNSLIEFFVHWSCRCSMNVAFQYFWEKLSEEKKLPVRYAKMSATSVKYSVTDDRRDIFYFLATNMNENQLKELVERNPFTILNFWFREGVRQNRFLFTYDDTVWNFRPSIDICAVLIDAAEFTKDNVASKCFGKRSQILFRNLWKSTPSHIKRSLFTELDLIWKFLSRFMLILDTETLQLIYDDATAEEKERINNFWFHTFENCISAGLSGTEDSLKEILLSLSSEQRNDERWPLLVTLDKWKEKHVLDLIMVYISTERHVSNL